MRERYKKTLSAFKCFHSFACNEELLEIEGVSECSWMSESFVVSQHLVSRYFPPRLSYLNKSCTTINICPPLCVLVASLLSLHVSLNSFQKTVDLSLTTWWRPCSWGISRYSETVVHTQWLQHCREWGRSIFFFFFPFHTRFPQNHFKIENTQVHANTRILGDTWEKY